jgi:hypothetical protein
MGVRRRRKNNTMAYYQQVSEENLKKVEAFFVRRCKEIGSNRIEATVVDIADGSGVALATAHKAIKELQKNKTLNVIKPASRRFAISYVYLKDIEGFEAEQTAEHQLQYLKDLVISLQEENRQLRNQLQEAKLSKQESK